MGLIQVRVRRKSERKIQGEREWTDERKQGVPGAGGVCVIFLICVFIFGLVFTSVLRCDVFLSSLS